MVDRRVDELRALLPQCRLSDWNRLGARLVHALREGNGSAPPSLLTTLLREAQVSAAACAERRQRAPIPSYPPDLPITARKDEIVEALRRHQVVVIAGETGSGKTTQIPKMCLEAGLGREAMIGCTQPRRVAAVSISQRLAEELRVSWGHEVGCKIRFDDKTGPDTYIKLMTDGILLAETHGDPLLSEYNAIIIDEAHERSLNIDFLLGYLKGLLLRRADLKLVITSATIDTGTFSRAFGDAPIIEVSGRVYPVEVRYAALDDVDPEDGTGAYVEAAVRMVENLCQDSGDGDVLVFMPTERDIRETVDLVSGRCGRRIEVVPLYGRLSNTDQQKVFAPSEHRKIIVATNLAETSLTIPGIRFVIDTGLARMSRYDSRTRTKRLPVEPIAQSSANQRRGRAGRVQAGVCIRLYSEEDFNERPAFTQPEIQRANLAEVILKMKAFHLGEIETFPFVHAPAPTAIQAGYALLTELGALDSGRELTPLGEELARLPIDPSLGRMLLQSRVEGFPQEILIIASGLSLVDPRERPSDQVEAADLAHRRYTDPRSDFLSLLNLWKTLEREWQNLGSTGQQRRYCRTHFLSYLRLREWQDLYQQLAEALGPVGSSSRDRPPAGYDAIHRAVITGLFGHLGCRIGRNLYRGASNRDLMIFPGSALFQRNEKSRSTASATPRGEAPGLPGSQGSQPGWIVAGEIVQTSQLFARMVAEINPEWVVELAPGLCRRSHHHPRWDAHAGKVLAEERWTLHGMEVHRGTVAFGNIDPESATEIFIRGALVEEGLDAPEPDSDTARVRPPIASPSTRGATYGFLEHNRRTRQRVETWRTRVRQGGLLDLDEVLYRLYRARLPCMSSLAELNRWLREPGKSAMLQFTEEELSGRTDLDFDADSFPDQVRLGNATVPASYVYAPGEEIDGVTLRVPVNQAVDVSPATAAWAIPGWRSSLVDELLRGVPKSIRRALMPLQPKVVEIVRDLRPSGTSLVEEMGRFIRQRYGVEVPPGAWRMDAIPTHLLPRIEVIGPAQKPLIAGRDLAQIRSALPVVVTQSNRDSGDWDKARRKWERFGITDWTSDDLPEKVAVGEAALGQFAWPALVVEDESVHVRLLATPDAAAQANAVGLTRLLRIGLAKELAWMERDLRSLARCVPLYATLGSAEELQTTAQTHLERHVLAVPSEFRLNRNSYLAALSSARERLRGLVPAFVDQLSDILELRQLLAARFGAASTSAASAKPAILNGFHQLTVVSRAPALSPWSAELAALLPPRFLERISHARLFHLPRYLKALQIRAERAALQPDKEQTRRLQLAPYVQAVFRWEALPGLSSAEKSGVEELRWLVEEYKVSLFAQELGTSVPVSPKRLDQHLARLDQLAAAKPRR